MNSRSMLSISWKVSALRPILDLVTGEDGPLTECARSLRIPVRVLPELVQPISPFNDLRAASALIGHFRTRRPDLVHAHTSKAGILTRLAAAGTDTPAVFTAHIKGWYGRTVCLVETGWAAVRASRGWRPRLHNKRLGHETGV